MAHLHEVRTVRDSVAETCVDRIREALAIAEGDPLRGVAIFYQRKDGSFGTAYCLSDDASMVGGLEIVKARIIGDIGE